MARLPGDRYVIQQIAGLVILFRRGSEEEILRFKPSDADACAKAQRAIYLNNDLNDEEKCFAHFWSGYFYCNATQGIEGES